MNSIIKSPLNYVGGKTKILTQIFPLFPKHISTFVDLFGGGFNVGINATADTIIYNDINSQVAELIEYLKNNNINKMLADIKKIIEEYGLSKTNEEGYYKLREDYNANKNVIYFYVLICYAFNNMIRFNSDNIFNMPFGKDRSEFNESLEYNFIQFCKAVQTKNCIITNSSFTDFDLSKIDTNSFIYCDPPYLNTNASYNSNMSGWTEENEEQLLTLLNKLSSKNIKWALSNNLTTNPKLKEFAEQNNYYINNINCSYSNCSYNKLDKTNIDYEVLITNYKVRKPKLF